MSTELRSPVKKFESACAWGADTVASSIEGARKNKYVTSASKSFSTFDATVVTKTNPILNVVPAPIKKISSPVIPYMQQGEKTVGRSGLIAAAVSVPVFFTLAAVALFTSPVWMFFGLITSFFWVPVVIVGALFVVPISVAIALAIFASRPVSRKQVANKWTEFKKFVSGYSVGKKLLYTSETKSASKTVTSTVPSAGVYM